MKKQGIIIIAILALIAGVAIYFWRQHESADRLPDTIVSGNGRIEMTRSDVAAKYPGRLMTLTVHEGDMVRAGQLVARQDDTDAQAQLAAAEASRQRALAASSRAAGEQAAYGVQEKLALLNLRESRKLYQRQLVSAVEVEQRELAVEAARKSIDAAGGGVGEAKGAIAQAEAQIRQAKAASGDLDIRAPVTGRVEYRIVEPGTVLAPGGKILSIVDPDDVYLTIFLPATVAARLRVGDEARIVPQGFPNALPARVTYVSADAQFTPKFVETADERDNLSYRVKLGIPKETARAHSGQLKAGMTADGYVRTDPSTPWPALAAAPK